MNPLFWRTVLQATIKYLSGLSLFLIIIELLAVFVGFPHLNVVINGVYNLFEKGILLHDISVSLMRCLIGWSVGSAIGISLGFFTGRIQVLSTILEGFFVLLRAVPFVTLLPIALRIWGLSETGKFFLVAWASAGVCWVIVHQASKSIKPEVEWRARSLGCGTIKWIFLLLLPTCSSGIKSALRTSILLGLVVVAVAEMGGVFERSTGYWWSEGLGYRIFRSYEDGSDDLMIGAILIFSVLGVGLDMVFLGLWNLTTTSLEYTQRRKAVYEVLALNKVKETFQGIKQTPSGLQILDLSAGYDGNNVVEGFNLYLEAGKTLSIVGPSGCGKTTLIRALGHFIDREFKVNGVVKTSDFIRTSAGSWVGVVFQDSPVFEHLTVWGNVIFGNNVKATSDRKRALTLLEDFGLKNFFQKKASSLSGGQRQRLALATALANKPSILLLDEPFGALDAITRRKMQEFFWKNVHGRSTSLFVTHDIEEALIIGDIVRVGVDPNSVNIEVKKSTNSPYEWETSDEFNFLRKRLLAALNGTYE